MTPEATPDGNPTYLTQGVACLPDYLPVPLRLMRTRPLPASPFAKALEESSLAGLEAEREALLGNIAVLDNHLRLLNLAIEMKRTNGQGKVGGPKPSLREGIFRILNDSTPLRPNEIYNALDEHGWAPQGKNAKAQVAARLSKLVESGHLARVGEIGSSRYTLPTKTADSGRAAGSGIGA